MWVVQKIHPIPEDPPPPQRTHPHPCHTSAYISFPVLLYIIMWARIWRVYAIITAFPFSWVCLHLYWPVSLLAWVHPSEISFLLLSVLGRYSLYVHLSEETITLLLSSNCLGMNSQLEIPFLCRLKALLRPHPRARAAAVMSSHHPIFLIFGVSWPWLSSSEVSSSLLSIRMYLSAPWVFSSGI